jgi:hypothetical protein
MYIYKVSCTRNLQFPISTAVISFDHETFIVVSRTVEVNPRYFFITYVFPGSYMRIVRHNRGLETVRWIGREYNTQSPEDIWKDECSPISRRSVQ